VFEGVEILAPDMLESQSRALKTHVIF